VLMRACALGHKQIVKLLLEHNAKADVKNAVRFRSPTRTPPAPHPRSTQFGAASKSKKSGCGTAGEGGGDGGGGVGSGRDAGGDGGAVGGDGGDVGRTCKAIRW
jgi:hypothetical protein